VARSFTFQKLCGSPDRWLAQTPALWGLRSPEGILWRRRLGARTLSCIMLLHKRHYSPGQLQFITASTYQRAPLFLSERFRGGFVETLARVRQEMTFLVIGWLLNLPLLFLQLQLPISFAAGKAARPSHHFQCGSLVKVLFTHNPAKFFADRFPGRYRFHRH